MEAKKNYSRNKLLQMMDQNSEEVDELMAIFVKMVPDLLADLQTNIENKEWKAASSIAHKLKSSMRLWDITTLDDDVVFIETNGLEESQTEEVERRSAKLIAQLFKVIEEMKMELA